MVYCLNHFEDHIKLAVMFLNFRHSKKLAKGACFVYVIHVNVHVLHVPWSLSDPDTGTM